MGDDPTVGGGDGGSGQFLFRAVVIEVINNIVDWSLAPGPTEIAEDSPYRRYVAPTPPEGEEPPPGSPVQLGNPSYLKSAPRNSCIVQIISGGKGKSSKPLLCFPFFPPHICMPVVPGEQVWVISESTQKMSDVPFWIARIPENIATDGINFTHGDRETEAVEALPTSEKLETESGNVLPGFENGAAGNTTLPVANPEDDPDLWWGENPYEAIFDNSKTYPNFVPDIVPRFNNRPGDLALQGSNNTLICLGTDRGWNATEDLASPAPVNSNVVLNPYANADGDASGDLALAGVKSKVGLKAEVRPLDNVGMQSHGTIDIVAGRGRFYEPPTVTDANAKCADPMTDAANAPTAPYSIENTRKLDGADAPYNETDKNPIRNKVTDPYVAGSIIEGDPDFVTDCSRIYVSMNTSGDKLFGICQKIEDKGGTLRGLGMASGFEAPIEDVDNSPYVILKSDEVRIIARNDPTNKINGSIRLVKEGKPNEDLATVALLPDGTIQISGSKIFLGRAVTDIGSGGEKNEGAVERKSFDTGAEGPGPGGSQPYIRYQDLEDLWNLFMDEISTFCDNMTGAPTPGYGTPSPKIDAAVATLKGAIASTHKPNIANVKSDRIFGE